MCLRLRSGTEQIALKVETIRCLSEVEGTIHLQVIFHVTKFVFTTAAVCTATMPAVSVLRRLCPRETEVKP